MTDVTMTTQNKGLSKKGKAMVAGLVVLALSFYFGFMLMAALVH